MLLQWTQRVRGQPTHKAQTRQVAQEKAGSLPAISVAVYCRAVDRSVSICCRTRCMASKAFESTASNEGLVDPAAAAGI